MQEKSRIVHASAYVDALKSSGYKSTYNAIAEIVDNSIDANAKNVFIIGEQKQVSGPTGRLEKRIDSFAFLDDGDGMDFETIKSCLSIGYGTKKERVGMGRYGVGLPQASVFVCNRVEVYSWQGGIDNCKYVYLDLDEVVEQDLNELGAPEDKSIPEKYQCYINWKDHDIEYDFSEHGTLVVWTKCTKVDHRKWNTCKSHMEEDLGRKYRYFLNNGVNILMCELVSKETKAILPNDPLYLMSPSQECLKDSIIDSNYTSEPYNPTNGYTECMFEPYQETLNHDGISRPIVKYYDKNGFVQTTQIEIKYSIVKEKYYSQGALVVTTKPGQLNYGKTSKIKNNTGISFIRQCREIDFGNFGFFNIYNCPEHRWWGCEISFPPELDELFGISNNKQYVDFKPMTDEELEDCAADEVPPLWMQLHEEISKTIQAMVDRNSDIRSKTDANTDDDTKSGGSETGYIVDQSEKHNNDNISVPEENLTEEEKREKARDELKAEGIENATEKQIDEYLLSNVRFRVERRGKFESFMTYAYAAGVMTITLNQDHDFFRLFVDKTFEDNDEKIAFQLLIAGILKTVLDLHTPYPTAMDIFTKRINDRLFNYMIEYKEKKDIK